MSLVAKQRREKARFFAIAARLMRTKDASERVRLKAQLAHLTFGA
jgi:hypothetical protein